MTMMRTEQVKTPEQDRIAEEMRRAISAYSGPVTKCPPGEASAAYTKKTNPAIEYLKAHRDDPPDAAAEARRHRVARMKRQRISKHNAPIMRRMEKQERTQDDT